MKGRKPGLKSMVWSRMKKQEFKTMRGLGTPKKKKMIKNMNTKMTINSQLSTTEPKKQTQTKQTIRTGMETQKWISHGRLSSGRGGGKTGEKVQGIRNINGRYKIDRGKFRIV